jgi:hypothetical protein
VNEVFPKPIEDLTTVDGWVHHELELNKLGRNRPLPEVEEEEGRVTSTEEPLEEIAPLRSLADDEKGTWGFRTTPAGAGAGPNSAVSTTFVYYKVLRTKVQCEHCVRRLGVRTALLCSVVWRTA